MRDAFGGAFMLKLFLFFIIIYICIMAGAISYTKAFRVKNGIINIIEQNSFGGSSDTITTEKISDYLQGVNYNYEEEQLRVYCTDMQDNDVPYIFVNGACIVPHYSDVDNGQGDVYYEVATFVHIELPFFGININVPVHGESKIIY